MAQCLIFIAYILPIFYTVAKCYEGDIFELSEAAGYIAEPHDVVTEDGYILTIFRILTKLDTNESLAQKKPVLLQHGFACSCENFVQAGNESLAFFLAQESHDVWIGNTRGNFYSLGHESYSVESEAFWQFTFDHHGKYDLPAMIDYILNINVGLNITVVGHSQGSGLTVAMLAGGRPEYGEKVNLHIALASAVYLKNTKAWLLQLISQIVPLVQLISKTFRIYQIPAVVLVPILKQIVTLFCGQSPFIRETCSPLMFFFEPVDHGNVNLDYVSTFFKTTPAGFGIHQLLALAEITRTGIFARYNWGPELNMKFYNSTEAAPYNLSQVTTKVAIVYGENDGLVVPRDVARLQQQLRNCVENYQVPNELFTHFDFLVGLNIRGLLNEHILYLIKTHAS